MNQHSFDGMASTYHNSWFHLRLVMGSIINPVIISVIVCKLFGSIITFHIQCWVQVLFTVNVFPGTVTFIGFTLMIKSHLGVTVQTTQLLWAHRGEDQMCLGRVGFWTGGNRRRNLKDGGASENLLLRGFNFTFFNLKIFPDSSWRGGKV